MRSLEDRLKTFHEETNPSYGIVAGFSLVGILIGGVITYKGAEKKREADFWASTLE